jgi:hypothetical protein
MIIDTSHLLVGVNSAANFFLYYLLRKNFRSATWRLLTCKGLDQQGRGHYSNRTNNGGQSAVPTSITLNNGDRSNRITNLSRNATLVECTTPTRSVTIIAQLSVWCVRSSFVACSSSLDDSSPSARHVFVLGSGCGRRGGLRH